MLSPHVLERKHPLLEMHINHDIDHRGLLRLEGKALVKNNNFLIVDLRDDLTSGDLM